MDNQRKKFTDGYIEELRNNFVEEARSRYSDKIASLQKTATLKTDFYMNNLEREIMSFFSAPISQSFANKIMAYRLAGVELSDAEIEILRGEAESYSEMKVLNAICEKRTKKVERHTENGVEIVEEKNPYLMDCPNLETIMKEFKDFKRKVKFVISDYCGTAGELHDSLNTDNPSYVSVSADNYFASKAAERFRDVLNTANLITPEGKEKARKLTPQEREFIDLVVNPDFPLSAKKQAVAMAEAIPDMRSLLLLDERYASDILKAEAEEAEEEATV